MSSPLSGPVSWLPILSKERAKLIVKLKAKVKLNGLKLESDQKKCRNKSKTEAIAQPGLNLGLE